nr:MAG TPA: hypothetical protein [Microviridae sp.]
MEYERNRRNFPCHSELLRFSAHSTAIELHFLHEFINKATSIKITTCMRMLCKSKGK